MSSIYDIFSENLEHKLDIYKKFYSNKLFSNLKLRTNVCENYEMKCISCDNMNIINSTKYLLQRCNKCRIEYVPTIKK
jgi:hypothetical protein